LDVLLEPGHLLACAIEACCQSERRGVGKRHGLVPGGHSMKHEDRQKHLLFPQWMRQRRLGERWTYEKAACQRTVRELLAARQEARVARAELRHVTREILV